MSNRTLKALALFFVMLLAVCVLGCRALQRKVLFFPSHHERANGFTRWIHDGATIGYAREVPQPRTVWFMLHGNGGQAADRQYAMYAFDPADSVYILEYPGYGERAGRPSRRAFDAAAREGYADLRARFAGKPLCVLGESLGSGPASMLSRENPPPDKIVLIVPFDSIKSVARDHVKWLPTGLILAGTWDNIEALAGYAGPIEIFGAQNDEVIAVRHAQRLAQSLPQARFHLLPGGHGWANQQEIRFHCP
jgi:pimeloyl-ACP methyl ester carboxylesterase